MDNYGYMGSIEMGPGCGSLGMYFAAGARQGSKDNIVGLYHPTAALDAVFVNAWNAGYKYAQSRKREGKRIHPDVFTTSDARVAFARIGRMS